MAYFTGTATNNRDFFDQLRSIVGGVAGWTTSVVGLDEHVFENDGLKVSIDSNIAGSASIDLNVETETTATGSHNLGVIGEYPFTTQLGQWHQSDPIVSFHVFIDSGTTPTVYAAVEINAGIWRHFQFGILEKAGSWVGGAFLFLTYSSDVDDWDDGGAASIGITAGNFTNRQGYISYTDELAALVWGSHSPSSTNYVGGNRTCKTTGYNLGLSRAASTTANYLLNYQPNPDTGQTIILPVEAYVLRDGAKYSRCGVIPAIGLINIKNMQDAQTIVIGGDTWRVFPVRAKGFISSNGLAEESNYLGIAYKQ